MRGLVRFSRSFAATADPLVAIVGAPNTGKSTLFNRIVHGQTSFKGFKPRALISATAGTTRDRIESCAEWAGVRFRVNDTGGVLDLLFDEEAALVQMERAVEAQVLRAINEASIVVFLTDAKRGVTAVDMQLASILRRRKCSGPVLLSTNKVGLASVSAQPVPARTRHAREPMRRLITRPTSGNSPSSSNSGWASRWPSPRTTAGACRASSMR